MKWQRRSKVPPNARCFPSYDFSAQKVNVQWKFTNILLLFMVTKRFLRVSSHKETSSWKKFDDDDEVQEEVMTWFRGQAAEFYDSEIQKLVPRLNQCLDDAGDFVEKQSCVQAIHSKCRFCKLKMLYTFKTFVSVLSAHASCVLTVYPAS